MDPVVAATVPEFHACHTLRGLHGLHALHDPHILRALYTGNPVMPEFLWAIQYHNRRWQIWCRSKCLSRWRRRRQAWPVKLTGHGSH